jgi:hypothetical protein
VASGLGVSARRPTQGRGLADEHGWGSSNARKPPSANPVASEVTAMLTVDYAAMALDAKIDRGFTVVMMAKNGPR